MIKVSSSTVYIVMEYADGGDIAGLIERRKFSRQPFSEDNVMDWFAQMLEALAFIHRRAYLHRDIKTANMFLTKEGQVKLGDFGITRLLEENADRISARTCTTPVGTPMYMAPELLAKEAYGQKADIWGLGCVLYEMCTLKPAFMARSMSQVRCSSDLMRKLTAANSMTISASSALPLLPCCLVLHSCSTR